MSAEPFPTSPPPAPAAPAETSALAIVAFVGSFFVPVLGIVLGHVSLAQVRRTHERGRGFAIAGLAIGYAWLAFVLLVVLAWTVFALLTS